MSVGMIPHGPYLIGGYCAGGYGAIEVARHLLQQGERVDLLVAIHLKRAVKPKPRLRYRPGPAIENSLEFAGKALRLSPEQQRDLYLLCLHCRTRLPSSLPRTRTDWSRVLGGSLQAFRQSGLQETLAPMLRTAQQEDPCAPFRWATRSFRQKPYPGRLTIFVGDEDLTSAPWHKMADEVDIHVVPSDHDTFVENFPGVAERLRMRLSSVR